MADNPKKSIMKANTGSSPEITERFTSQYPTVPPAEVGLLRVQDLNTILEVNQKALTIYLEVEKQNEDILGTIQESQETLELLPKMNETLNKIADKQILQEKATDKNEKAVEELKKKIEDLDKNFFRLILVLGSTGVGTILNLIQSYLSTK